MTIIRCEYDGVIWDLDVLEEQPIRVDVSAIENSDIGSVFGASSQQFTLPGSKKNNRFFKHAYKVGVSGVPGLGESVRASVITNSNTLLEGSLFLEEVIRTPFDGVNYNVIVVDDVVSFNESVKTVALKDLKWSDLEHDFSLANVTGSWVGNLVTTGSITTSAIYYPLIDQGRDGSQTTGSMADIAIDTAETASLGFINNSSTPIQVQQLTPAVKVSTVLDKIFERGGFSYSSSLQPLFDQLYILPKQTETLDVNGAGFTDNNFSANQLGTQTLAANSTTTVDINNDLYDPSNSFNTTTHLYTVPFNGLYDFTGSIVYEYDSSELEPPFGSELILRIRNNTQSTLLGQTIFTNVLLTGSLSVQTNPAILNVGDEIEMEMRYNPNQAGTYNLLVASGSFASLNAPINYESGKIKIGEQFDPQTKCIDLLKGLIEKFNLVIEPVYTENKVLKIESYNNWIQSGQVKDWTQKVEKAKRIGISHPLSSQPKTLVFEDNKDNDKLSKQVIDGADGYQWGTEVIDAVSDVPQGERKVGSFFAPVILEEMPGSPQSLIPQLYKTDDTQQDRKTFKFKPRLGYKVSGSLATIGYIGNAAAPFTDYATISNYDTLPVVSGTTKNLHFNDSFYPPTFLTGSVSTKNAYVEYWNTYIEDLYEDDNRILNLDLEFTPEELQDIALNNRIFVEDTLYRINRISGYNLVSPDVVNVELIKIKPTGDITLNCNFDFEAPTITTTTTTSTTAPTTTTTTTTTSGTTTTISGLYTYAVSDEEGFGSGGPGSNCCQTLPYPIYSTRASISLIQGGDTVYSTPSTVFNGGGLYYGVGNTGDPYNELVLGISSDGIVFAVVLCTPCETTTTTTTTSTTLSVSKWIVYPCDGTGFDYVVEPTASLAFGQAFYIDTETEGYYALTTTNDPVTANIVGGVYADCASLPVPTTTTTTTTLPPVTQIYSDSQPGSGDLSSCGCEGAITAYNYQVLGSSVDITQDMTGDTIYEDWDTGTLFVGDDKWYCIATSNGVTPQYSIQINNVGIVTDWTQSIPCTTTTTTTIAPASLEVYGRSELGNNSVELFYSVNQGTGVSFFQGALDTTCSLRDTLTGFEEGDVITIYEGTSDFIEANNSASNCPTSAASSTSVSITLAAGTNAISVCVDTGATTTTTTTTLARTNIWSDSQPGSGDLGSCGCESQTTAYMYEVLGIVDITQDMTGETVYEDIDTNTLFQGDDKWYCIGDSQGITPTYSIQISNLGQVLDWVVSQPCTTTTTTTVAPATLEVDGKTLVSSFVEVQYTVNQGATQTLYQNTLGTSCTDLGTITGLVDGDVVDIFEGTTDFIAGANGAGTCPSTVGSSTSYQVTVGGGLNQVSITINTGATTTTTTTTTTLARTEIYSDSQPGSGDLASCGCETVTTAYNYQVLGANVDITQDMTGKTIYENIDTNTLFVGDDKWYCIATSNGVTPSYSIQINNSGIVLDWTASSPCPTTTTTTTTTLDPNACYEYTVECLNAGGCFLQYTDCNGNPQDDNLAFEEIGLICARPTPSLTGGTVTFEGNCTITTTTTTTTTAAPTTTTTTTTTAAPTTTTTTTTTLAPNAWTAERNDGGATGWIAIAQGYNSGDSVLTDDGSGICWTLGTEVYSGTITANITEICPPPTTTTTTTVTCFAVPIIRERNAELACCNGISDTGYFNTNSVATATVYYGTTDCSTPFPFSQYFSVGGGQYYQWVSGVMSGPFSCPACP